MTRIIPLSQLEHSSELTEQVSGGVVSIGNFDGVHLGHSALLGTVRQLADRIGGPAVAVVFDPHPAVLLRPDRAPPKLTWIERRAELMSPLGIDALVVCHTTPEFLRLTAPDFFQSLIVSTLQAATIVEGPNFFFGRDRGGDIHVLSDLCAQHGIAIHIVAPSKLGESMISSTRIRRLLAAGQVAEAARLLGANYRIRGQITGGAGRGRQIGFPTANLSEIDVVVPATGVYAAWAMVADRPHRAAVHLGPNPTFDSDQGTKVEVHLLDFEGDLYGQSLLVDFVARVRDIARFDSPDDLVSQLQRDIAHVRSLLKDPTHGC